MSLRVQASLEWRLLLSLARFSSPVESRSSMALPSAGFLEAGAHAAQPSGFCVPLKNEGSFSSLVVGVGEPQQQFSVVADTGSSAFLVASCECTNCAGLETCYDRAQSSSYVETEAHDRIMVFGSGAVKTKVITDKVGLGPLSVLMTEGVSEMMELQPGRFPPDFEGILGLGPPYVEKNFPTEAHFDHFSFCLQDSDLANGGVLQVDGTPSTAKQLGSIGKLHWGLGLNGVSIGDNAAGSRMSFCSPADMGPDQQTPCGAIPDSGTTMIAAPRSDLDELMSGICDAWPRCADSFASGSSKTQAVFELLKQCNSWIHDGDGLDELPVLNFHLTGADGIEEPISLSPWAYVIEMSSGLYDSHAKSLLGLAGSQPAPPEDGSSAMGEMTCSPAFQVIDMQSSENGPLWILGTSFFYEYVIHHTMSPQTISFERGECGTCEDGAGDQFFETAAARRGVRRLSQPPRLPMRYQARHGVM